MICKIIKFNQIKVQQAGGICNSHIRVYSDATIADARDTIYP